MQVLHSHWLLPDKANPEGRLLIWAETSAVALSKYDRRKRAAQPHPFALNPAQIMVLLAPIWAPRKVPLVEETVTLWLPTDKLGPLPSPTLIHDWPWAETPIQLQPWCVTGVQLKAEDGLLYLVRATSRALVGAQMGSGTRYLQQLSYFVLEILAQQKLRPLLIPLPASRGTTYAARWEPVLDNELDTHRLRQLAAAMPAICQAVTADPNEPLAPPALIDHFLNSMVDAAGRWWGGQRELYLPTEQTPAAQWLRALFAPQVTFTGHTAPLAHLYSSYQSWSRALTVAGDKYYRVAFRLEAPSEKGGGWQLHYLLQARDDASLLVPAAAVWSASGRVLELLNRRFDRPQERLLVGLGYASRFFAPIQHSLNQPNPIGIQLTAEEAVQFLRHCVPQLEQSGFGLLVPPWWNRPGARLGVRLKLSNGRSATTEVASGHMGLDKLVNYQWQLSLGDMALSQAEFEGLVALKSPLVQIRGQWVQLDADQIEAAIQFWQKQAALTGELSPLTAMRLGLKEQETYNGLAVDEVTIDGWLNEWLAQLQGEDTLTLLPPPAALQATLRPYQQYGFSWLDFARRLGLGGILADDMGLGKTIQTLALIQKLKSEAGQLPAPILLICPTSVVLNWQMESHKFTPQLETLVHQGSDRLRGDAFVAQAKKSDMVLTSYALVRRDEIVMQQIDWFGIVLDEAQNIKNAQTKQARAIRQLSSQFRIALTGTPVENRLSELWSIMHFLNPGFLGNRHQFRKQFVLPIEKYSDQAAAEKLRQLIKPFILRRLKTDPTVITDLPEKQEVKVYCHLSQEQATLYEAIVQDVLQAIDAQAAGGMARKGLVLSMLMQLKQVCNHPAQYLHEGEGYHPLEDEGRSGKLARFHALLEEILAKGDRLLVFTQFKEMGGFLKQYIQTHFGVATLFLHGGVRPKQRAEMVRQFQEGSGPPVFVLSLKAGGTGLNLTAANHVFHFDRWWNPAVEDQATDRAFRIGQKRNVLVHKFVCLGTLEERIDQMITDKKALADSIVGQGENWLTEMSTADLRALVTLR